MKQYENKGRGEHANRADHASDGKFVVDATDVEPSLELEDATPAFAQDEAPDVPLHTLLSISEIRAHFDRQISLLRTVWWILIVTVIADGFVARFATDAGFVSQTSSLTYIMLGFVALGAFVALSSSLGRDVLNFQSSLDRFQERASRYSLVLAALGILVFFGDTLLRSNGLVALAIVLIAAFLYLPGFARSIRESRQTKRLLARHDLLQYEKQSKLLFRVLIVTMVVLRCGIFLASLHIAVQEEVAQLALGWGVAALSFLVLLAFYPSNEKLLTPCSRCGIAVPVLVNIRFCAACPFSDPIERQEAMALEEGVDDFLSDRHIEKLSRVIRKKEGPRER